MSWDVNNISLYLNLFVFVFFFHKIFYTYDAVVVYWFSFILWLSWTWIYGWLGFGCFFLYSVADNVDVGNDIHVLKF